MATPVPMPISSPSENRTVIVVGKTGAGKSTVANVVLNRKTALNELEEEFEVKCSLESVTPKCSHRDSIMTDNGKYYNVRVIDTVGLFDTMNKSVDTTVSDMKQYMLNFCKDGLNLVLFTMREGRFSDEEKVTFDFIIKNFREEISNISALVITHCDIKAEEEREKIIRDFKESSKTANIASFMQKGIFTVGFPSLSDRQKMKRSLRDILEEGMVEDQKTLLNLLITADEAKVTDKIFKPTFWEKCVSLCKLL